MAVADGGAHDNSNIAVQAASLRKHPPRKMHYLEKGWAWGGGDEAIHSLGWVPGRFCGSGTVFCERRV